MKKKKFEFSKIIIGLLLSTYFIVLALGIFVVLNILNNYPEYSVQALVALFSYVGVVNGIAIPFYLKKSERENIHKNPDIQTISEYQSMNNIGCGMGEDLSNINNNDNSKI